MYEGTAILKKETGRTLDDYGNEILTYSGRTVYVHPRGVYQSEFYNAAVAGLHPSITLTMTNRADYEGEKIVEYNGVNYNVVRVNWNGTRDKIDLVLEERARDLLTVPTE